MWSKRKEDELPQRPERPVGPPAHSPAPVEPQRRESNIMSSPSRNFDPEPASVRSGSAALGKNVTVKGQIFAREDLTIDGEVEGTVECHEHRLTIGPNARVQAGLKAREIIIQGSIHGNVTPPTRSTSRRKPSWSATSKPAASSSKTGLTSRAASIFRSRPRQRNQRRRRSPNRRYRARRLSHRNRCRRRPTRPLRRSPPGR
jgi:hypothetical protein